MRPGHRLPTLLQTLFLVYRKYRHRGTKKTVPKSKNKTHPEYGTSYKTTSLACQKKLMSWSGKKDKG